MKKLCFGWLVKAKVKCFKKSFVNQQQTFNWNYAFQLKDNFDHF